ncbi:hypothetical protein ACHAWF_016698 [Thalassiosira exigua]
MSPLKLPLFVSIIAACDAWCQLTRQKPYSRASRSQGMDSSTVLAISNAPFLPDVVPPTITIPPYASPESDITFANSDESSYLIHKGRAVDMIKRCVSIEGLSLCTGWTRQATDAFKIAIEAVVCANPILAGKLVEVKKWPLGSELRIVPNAFPPESHSFVTTVNLPPGMTNPRDDITKEGNSAKALFEQVHSTVAPCLLGKASFSANQIEDESPLFEAKIMDFGDGVAAYSMKMSHAIGDGTTFFQIVSQISSFMNGRTPSKIDWNNPLRSTHEIYPDNFSERDYSRSYGLPFGWGIFKNLRTLAKRKCKYILLRLVASSV